MNHDKHEIGTMTWLKFQASEIARLYKEEPNEASARLYRIISDWNKTSGLKPMEKGETDTKRNPSEYTIKSA